MGRKHNQLQDAFVAQPDPTYLKLVSASLPAAGAGPGEDSDHWNLVRRAFELATGWPLTHDAKPAARQNARLIWSAPDDPGVGAPPGRIRIAAGSSARPGPSPKANGELASREAVGELACSLSELWNELLDTREALREREADLAAAVPLRPRTSDGAHLAVRLEAVLRAAAESVGCQRAALYLLDEATTELCLRSSHGLPRRRMLDPARPLEGALADLVALLGHAVVLSDRGLLEYWHAPEPCGAAVCLPVNSSTTQLGSLWVFSDEARDFSDAQTNLLEVVTGRLAAELEREVLLTAATESRSQARQFAAAAESSLLSLPSVAPKLAGWDIAGWAGQAEMIGGAYFDWFSLADRSLALLVGSACEPGLPGAMTACALRGAARAAGPYRLHAQSLLPRLNEVLWSCSAGHAGANLLYALLDPGAEQIRFAAAGNLRVLLIRPGHSRLVAAPSAALGIHESLSTPELSVPLSLDQLCLAYCAEPLGARPDAAELLDEILVQAALGSPSLPAQELAAIVGSTLARQSKPGFDMALLVIKRRT